MDDKVMDFFAYCLLINTKCVKFHTRYTLELNIINVQWNPY